MSQYKNPVCRGSYELGTACRTCEKCVDERLQRVKDHEFDHTKYTVSKAKKGCPNCAELKAENERLRGDLECITGLIKNSRIDDNGAVHIRSADFLKIKVIAELALRQKK